MFIFALIFSFVTQESPGQEGLATAGLEEQASGRARVSS